MKLRVLQAVSVAFVALSSLLAATHTNQPTVAPGLRVGVILPLTGEMASIGVSMRKGLQAALSNGPVNGLKVTFEDDQTANRTAAASATRKLLAIDKAELVLNDAMNTLDVISPILGQSQVPGVILWDSSQKIKNAGSHMFAMGYSTEGAGSDLADFASIKLHGKKAAIISAEDEWSELIAGAFAQQFTSAGGRIVLRENSAVNETDFRTLLAKIRSSEADTVYVPLFPDSLAAFLKQARASAISSRIFTGDGLVDSVLTASGSAAEGVYATQVWLGAGHVLPRNLREAISEGDPVNSAFVGMGYDAGLMLKAIASEFTNVPAKEHARAVLNILSKLSFEGVTGRISFGASRTSDKRETIVQVRGSKLVPVNQADS